MKAACALFICSNLMQLVVSHEEVHLNLGQNYNYYTTSHPALLFHELQIIGSERAYLLGET